MIDYAYNVKITSMDNVFIIIYYNVLHNKCFPWHVSLALNKNLVIKQESCVMTDWTNMHAGRLVSPSSKPQ